MTINAFITTSVAVVGVVITVWQVFRNLMRQAEERGIRKGQDEVSLEKRLENIENCLDKLVNTENKIQEILLKLDEQKRTNDILFTRVRQLEESENEEHTRS